MWSPPTLSPFPLLTLLIPTSLCYSSHHVAGEEKHLLAAHSQHRTHRPQARAPAHNNQTKESKEKEAEHITSSAEPLLT